MAPWGMCAADLGKELLDAATQGHAPAVEALLARGAPIESKDKNGRTALMLAAQHARVEVVQALLAKGADAAARDAGGATAWMLAVFPGGGKKESNNETIKLLPQPPRPKIAIEATWSSDHLYNSCVMGLEQLTRLGNEIQPDVLAFSAFRHYAVSSGKDLLEIGEANGRGVAKPEDSAFEGADGVLILTVHRAASCVVQQSADRLGLTLDFQLLRAKDRAVLARKSIGGGGLKALHAQMVTGQSQYLPVYAEWVKDYAEQAYWVVAEAWYRAA